MFGANDFNQQSNDDPAMLDNVAKLAQDPADTIVPSSPPPLSTAQSSSPFTPTTVPATPPAQIIDDEHRAEPAEGFSSSALPDPVVSTPSFTPATDTENDQTASTTTPDPATSPIIQSTSTPVQDSPVSESQSSISASPLQAPDQEHLAGLKQQALQHLEPLADHVDGTPEEMFKTTMMMIQANDNHTLLEKALEAAKKIEDDKVRAKAMLDVINEINYFSQNNSDNE